MSAILFFIIGLGLLLLYWRIRLFSKYFTQKEASKTEIDNKETELKLMTPMKTDEIIEKKENKGEEDEKLKALLHL